MVIQPALCLSVPGLTARASAPPPTAASDRADSVAAPAGTTPAPPAAPGQPVANPWPTLQAANLLTSQSSVQGPIGAVLTDVTRQELKAALERLQQSGVKFEYRRRFALPWIRPHRVEMTAQETVDQIARSKTKNLDRVEFTVTGAPRRGLRSLKDLQLLDGLKGAGHEVLSRDETVAAEAARALKSSGASFYSGNYYYDEEHGQDEFEAMRSLQGSYVYVTTSKGERYNASTPDQLAAVEFFYGGGKDCGLKESDLAHNIKAASDKGFTFYYERYAKSPYEMYTSGKSEFYAGKKGVPAILVEQRELGDLPALEARLGEFDRVYRDILKGPYELAGWEATYFPSPVLKASEKFGMTVAAAVYGELVRASAHGGRDRDSWENVGKLAQTLYDNSRTPFELARKASMVAADYAQHGFSSANRLLNDTKEAIGNRSHNPKAQEELEDLFFQLMKSTGSIACATEGLDLVRIAVGQETREQRIKLFTDLAGRQSEATLVDTSACYRSVLAERAPNEGVIETGNRLVKVLEACSVGRHQDRALEVFCAIQEGIREGRFDGRGADQVIAQFASHLVLSEDVDKAMNALLTGDVSMGSVAEKEDFVIIGGVRVPRK